MYTIKIFFYESMHNFYPKKCGKKLTKYNLKSFINSNQAITHQYLYINL